MSSDRSLAIRLMDVGKRYHLGPRVAGTLSETIGRWLPRRRRSGDHSANHAFPGDNPSSKNSNEFWAVRDVDLEIDQGDVLGLIGGNGAGKSTVLKMISQVTTPTTGGIDLWGRCASLLEVGTGFHPELTGRENVFMNAALLGMPSNEVRRRLDEIVDFAGVGEYFDVPIKRYSSGMRVRLGFAVAAHLEPEILIIDEVLTVGDAEFQARSLGRMRSLAASGKTILFVSHNLASIRQLCSRAVLLRAGKVVEQGQPETVIASYLGASGTTTATRRIFDDEHVSLDDDLFATVLNCSILPASGSTAGPIPVDQPLTYTIQLRVRGNPRRLRTGIMVHSSDGTIVFGTNTVIDPSATELTNHGDAATGFREYTVSCVIPAGTMNVGQYSITIGLDDLSRPASSYLRPDTLQLHIYDAIGHGPSRQQLPGVTRPAVTWSSQFQD